MPHILSNGVLEIHWDVPLQGYSSSRFDWTGKITKVTFRNTPMTTTERTDEVNRDLFGMGLYNEFGIDTALGFKEAKTGEWFHKIGVGALKKTDGPYLFTTPYEIRPAEFHYELYPEKIHVRCLSESLNGYAYLLIKEYRIEENGLIINYQLENTGQKTIETDEYVHNFMSVDHNLIGKDYRLRFSFNLQPEKFRALVNPEMTMEIREKEISFQGIPNEQVFISHLNGEQSVPAVWELQHLKSNTGIRETGSFSTQKVNLWGWQHVISPELFQHITIPPREVASWSRHYKFFSLD